MEMIAKALAKAQGEFMNPPKNKTANAGKVRYKYADLPAILDTVRPVLARNGLAFVQVIENEPTKNTLRTILMHDSGQKIESTYPLPLSAAAWEMGSAISYARRYSLSAILGIAADEDDDGAAATTAPADDETLRGKLVELMGAASVGNKIVMDYAAAQKLGAGRTVEELSIDAVKALLTDWDKAVAGMKELRKPPAVPLAEPPRPAEEAKTPDADQLPGLPDISGMAPSLAALMTQDNISKATLKAFYVAQGHFPATVEPEKLPSTYAEQLANNWPKASKKMKGTTP